MLRDHQANVFDVAAYVVGDQRRYSMIKLHTLVYYAQAWHLVWNEEPLFEARIEAWAGGPAVVLLYGTSRYYEPMRLSGYEQRLRLAHKETIDKVVAFYGGWSTQKLTDLVQQERPWKEARSRAGAGPGEVCSEEITVVEMAEYYEAIGSFNP